MSNIQDVARAAKVSTATVSRVLMRPELVAEATRLRVLKVVETLAYTPNRAAVSLRTLRTSRIVVSVPNIANPFFATVVRGIEERAQQDGYSVLLGDTRGDPAGEERFASMLLRQEADGLIFLGHRLPEGLRDMVARDGAAVPIVNGCEFSPELEVSSVHIDNRGAAKTAMEALYDLGHRSVGVITGPLTSPLSRDRLAGAREAAEERLLESGLSIVSGDFSIDAGRRKTHMLFRAARPTAIFCFSDEMAIGALAALRALDLRCPEDVSVMGFDDIEMARHVHPALTTTRQPMRAIGVRAAELLIDIMKNEGQEPRRITLPHKLVVRRSVGVVSDPARA